MLKVPRESSAELEQDVAALLCVLTKLGSVLCALACLSLVFQSCALFANAISVLHHAS